MRREQEFEERLWVLENLNDFDRFQQSSWEYVVVRGVGFQVVRGRCRIEDFSEVQSKVIESVVKGVRLLGVQRVLIQVIFLGQQFGTSLVVRVYFAFVFFFRWEVDVQCGCFVLVCLDGVGGRYFFFSIRGFGFIDQEVLQLDRGGGSYMIFLVQRFRFCFQGSGVAVVVLEVAWCVCIC